ncbi:MAG: hypothetical protein AB1429_10820 [Pseudomonadota bacterium]|jgi:hypothetical protein
MRVLSSIAAIGVLTMGSAATAGTLTYAQHLADLEKGRHGEIIEIVATPKDKAAVVATPSFEGPAVRVNLLDVSGDPIGVIDFKFKAAEAGNRTVVQAVQQALAHRLISAKNGLDPYPYDKSHTDRTYAQALVDETFAKHPEVIILAIHATPPHEKINIISGSTIGRIGKAADEDDLRVIQKGSTNLEVAENGKRFEAEAPLNDAKGKRIGALGVVFAYKAGDDKEALHQQALKVRDEMAAKIKSAAVLAQPR